jgi:integrase/recombinase XerD
MNVSAWRSRFEQYMTVRQWSARTVEGYGAETVRFLDFLEDQGVFTVSNISRELVEAYRTHLYYTLSHGRRLTATTQARRLCAVKAFVRFLWQEQYLLLNVGDSVELPRVPQVLPRPLLSEGEVEQLLGAPDITVPLGMRDRAVLEVLYSSGVRNTELRQLVAEDVHFERHELAIRFGKGRKSRMVPIGEEATHWLYIWLKEGRPQVVRDPAVAAVFLSWRGRPMSREILSDLVVRCGQRAGLLHKITPHGLRHSCATHMLARGAGLRHLQELLGHESPVTTQRYTRIELSDLHEVHRRCHPREVLA